MADGMAVGRSADAFDRRPLRGDPGEDAVDACAVIGKRLGGNFPRPALGLEGDARGVGLDDLELDGRRAAVERQDVHSPPYR